MFRELIDLAIVRIFFDVVFVDSFKGSIPETKDIYYTEVMQCVLKDEFPTISKKLEDDYEFRTSVYRLVCRYVLLFISLTVVLSARDAPLQLPQGYEGRSSGFSCYSLWAGPEETRLQDSYSKSQAPVAIYLPAV